MSKPPYVTVYRLQRDQRYIDSVQRATKTTLRFGLMKTHGLFGSDRWWHNIQSGKLPMHTARGVITKLYTDRMGDSPSLEMRSADGTVTCWPRYANDEQLRKLYAIGCPIEIDFVSQRSRFFSVGWWPKRQKIVVEVRLHGTAENPRA